MTGRDRGPDEPELDEEASEADGNRAPVRRAITTKSGPVALPKYVDGSGNPADTLIPPAMLLPDFAEEISDDLVIDAADSLRLLRAPAAAASEDSDGISLSEIGGAVELRHTTQKVVLRSFADADEDDTVVDLGTRKSDAEDGETEEIDAALLDHPTPLPTAASERTKTEDLEPFGED